MKSDLLGKSKRCALRGAPWHARAARTGLVVMHVDPKIAAARDERLALRVQSGRIDAVPVRLNDTQCKLVPQNSNRAGRSATNGCRRQPAAAAR